MKTNPTLPAEQIEALKYVRKFAMWIDLDVAF